VELVKAYRITDNKPIPAAFISIILNHRNVLVMKVTADLKTSRQKKIISMR